VWVAIASRPFGPFREALARRPAWRAAVIVLGIGGMIGYVLNDTSGTAAMAFAFVSTAMTYPALRERWTNG
jgi:4-hydroxybenzoate polyprenyltransferase